METNTLAEAKKRFSSIGFRLFIGIIIINALSIGVGKLLPIIGEAVPVLVSDYSSVFFCMMFVMYVIGEPIMLYILNKGPKDEQTVEKKKMSPGQLVIAIIMCYGGMMIANFVGLFLTGIIGSLKQSAVENPLATVVGSINPFVNFLFIVLIAPIIEELIFRKALMDRMVKYGEATAVVVSAILFGLYHQNLNQLVYTIFMGACFGFVYIKTRNVKYSIIMHMVLNFLGSFIGPVLMELSNYEKVAEMILAGTSNLAESLSATQMVWVTIYVIYVYASYGLIIAGVVLLIVKRKKFTFHAGDVSLVKGKRFRTVFLNVGMILYCLLHMILILVQLLA